MLMAFLAGAAFWALIIWASPMAAVIAAGVFLLACAGMIATAAPADDGEF